MTHGPAFADIERLVDALESPAIAPEARHRAAELTGAVLAAHGDAIATLVAALPDEVLDRLADDPVVAPVLLLHGVHPWPVDRRIAAAIDEVKATIAPGLDVSAERRGDRVTLTIGGPGSGDATVVGRFVRAVRGVAPEVTSVDVQTAVPVALQARPDRS